MSKRKQTDADGSDGGEVRTRAAAPRTAPTRPWPSLTRPPALPAQPSARLRAFRTRLAALNAQFREWIGRQDAGELWTDGAEDYARHAGELVARFADVLEAPAAAAPPRAEADLEAAPAARTAQAAAPATAPATAPAPVPAPAPAPPAPAAGMFNFGGGGGEAEAAQPGPFNFGGACAAAAPAPAAPAAGIFHFGPASTGAFAFAAVPPAAPAATAGGGDDDEAPEEQTAAAEAGGAEVLSRHRVKLNSMVGDSKKWTNRGEGTLSIRLPAEPNAAGARPPYLVFATVAGRVLLSAPLSAAAPPTPVAKRAAALMMSLVSVVGEGAQEHGIHMFTCVEGPAAREALQAALTEHVGGAAA
jgi:hypothetical protein